jgi:ABC-type multidrug transport system, ATPase and permease components
VLDDVVFTAQQGELATLIDTSGGGRSSACQLAARSWDATVGKITMCGVHISTVEPEALLKHYAMVFHDELLIRDLVMNNIQLYLPNSDRA